MLGLYSLSYAGFLVAHAGLTITAIALAMSPRLLPRMWLERFEKSMGRLLRQRALLVGALATLWVSFGLSLLMISKGYFGHSWSLHVGGLLAVICGSFWLLFTARPRARPRAGAIAKFILCLVTTCGLVVALELALRANPGLLPEAVIERLPEKGDVFFNFFEFDDEITVGYRYRPRTQFSQVLRESATYQYDTFRGLVPSPPPESHRILSQASFRADSLGYRNAEPLLDHYDIVVSGDSFTSHSVEPSPWPSRLSARLGTPVLNLGLQGYGPQNEVEAILRFGRPRRPRQIVLGYYEGNDLLDAEGYARRKQIGLGWREGARLKLPIVDRHVSTHLTRHVLANFLNASHPAAPDGGEAEFPYPFAAELANQVVQLGFSDTYLSLLSLSREGVEGLHGFELFLKAVERLQAACQEDGIRLLVAYFPTKEHCYIPLLDPKLVASKLGKAFEPELSRQGEFLLTRSHTRPLRAENLLQNIDCQRQSILEALGKRGIASVDLTPALQIAASEGAQLYWALDNHWTPLGHELAANVIREALSPPQ